MKQYDESNLILIVEDNRENAKLLEVVARRSGMSSIIAKNGNEALKKYKKQDNEISMILMDIQLPIMNGIEVTHEIRNIEKNMEKRTPIIAITAYAMREDRDKFISEGADDYLSKPIDLSDLYDIFDRYLKK